MTTVLVLNAGSSSLKASLIEAGREQPLARATVGWGSDATRAADRQASVGRALEQLEVAPRAVDGVGHRIVHGGPSFRDPVRLDQATLDRLDELSPLAPLHNPVGVDTARAALALLPGVPHVAVFDTAFHADLPAEGYVYPLPWAWYEEWGIRRYGFHGLAVESSVQRAANLLGRPPDALQLIVAHLGSGCSVTAVVGGRSVATSMGMTPLEGLMMGTRAGSVDPGILLRLLDDGRLGAAQLAEALDHGSGLLGVSGVSGDVREVTAAAGAGNQRASLALLLFARRTAEGIAAAASALSRLDALVFSGGIGENAGGLRARIVERLTVLGIAPIAEAESGADRLLSAPDAQPAVLRIEAREDLVVAEAVATLVG